jgi:hypothetical protein
MTTSFSSLSTWISRFFECGKIRYAYGFSDESTSTRQRTILGLNKPAIPNCASSRHLCFRILLNTAIGCGKTKKGSVLLRCTRISRTDCRAPARSLTPDATEYHYSDAWSCCMIFVRLSAEVSQRVRCQDGSLDVSTKKPPSTES